MATKTKPVEITNAADIRDAYMLVYANFATSPGDYATADSTEGKINLRYARQLFGVSTNAGLVAVSDVNGEEDVWQTFPETYDNMSEEEAEARIDEFLGTVKVVESDKPVKAKPAQTFHKCYCGCGENVPSKLFYRPGHDARHAGRVGKEIAANYSTPGFDRRDLPSALLSERLVAKAEAIAEKAIEREEKKNAPKVTVTEGTATRQQKEVIARRTVTKGEEMPVLEYLDDKGDRKPLAKSYHATFAADE